MGELADHLAALAEQTDEVRVVMLTGGLDGYFIAHADLDDLAKLAKGEPIEGDLFSWSRRAAPPRVDAAADGRRHRRPGVGRRVRDLAGLHDADRVRARAPRPARGRRRHHPGRRWHPTPPAARGRRPRGRALPQRPDRRRRRGRAHRAAERRAPRRGVPRRGHRVVPADQPPPRAGGLRGQASGRRGAARAARRRPPAGGGAVPRPSTPPTTPRRGTPPCPEPRPTSAESREPDGVRPHDRRPAAAPDAGPGPRRVRGRVLRARRHRGGSHRLPRAARLRRWRPTSICSPAWPSRSRGARW